MDYKIINVQDYAKGLDIASAYIHDKWGDKDNYNFYLDAIVNSSKTSTALPRFYLMLKGEEIVGCFAILTNDLMTFGLGLPVYL